MKRALLFLLFVPVFAVYFDASSMATVPSPLEDQGYLYLTFCSKSTETATFKFHPQGFTVSPTELSVYFSGSSALPDCRQIVVFVKARSPGMYNLIVQKGIDEWSIPVVFEKREPLVVSLSKSVLYTGYDTAKLYISGTGTDVWVMLNGSIVGTNVLHSISLPASFDITFYFPQAGYYSIPVSVTYRRGNSTVTQTYLLGLRVEEPPIEISSDTRVPAQGYANLTLRITSPETLYSTRVSLVSSCLEGETEKFVEKLKEEELVFRVKGKCDPGIYPLVVQIGNFQRTIPLEIYGPGGFDLMLSPTFEKDRVTLEVTVANIGSETMKAVSVKLLPGDYIIEDEGTFLGDLEPGDFDSADLTLIPKKNPVEVKYQIAYTKAGRRIVLNKTYELRIPQGKGSFWLLLLLIAGAVVYYVRTRKAGSEISHS